MPFHIWRAVFAGDSAARNRYGRFGYDSKGVYESGGGLIEGVIFSTNKSVHLLEFMATPAAKFIGVQAWEIVEYELSTDKYLPERLTEMGVI